MLQADLQTRLNRDVKPGLFRIVALKRLGSAPLPAGESGAPRVVVYFNTTLELAQDYSFGSWDQLGPAERRLRPWRHRKRDLRVAAAEPVRRSGARVWQR